MKKRLYFYTLLAFLVITATVQIIASIIALQAVSQYDHIVDSLRMAYRESGQVNFPLFQSTKDVARLCLYIMTTGAGTILLCSWGMLGLRPRRNHVGADRQQPEMHTETVKPAVAKAVTQPANAQQMHEKVDAEQVSSAVFKLIHKAHHDALTGLPNRSLAMDRLKQVLARAERHRQMFAVIFVDLNGFKILNDTYGHEFGDKVLRKTAERLSRSVRALDTVSRLGGDEFLIVLDQVDAAKALETAQNLSIIVRQPLLGEKGPVSVGMSAGIALFPEHGTTVAQLVRAADAAMYLSKRADGYPTFAASKVAAEASPPGRKIDATTTTISVRLLQTWRGKIGDLKSAKNR